VTEENPSLETRVAHLERSLRRTRVAAVAAGLLLFAFIGVQAARKPVAVQDVVRARRLVLVDDEGRVRAELAQDPKDTDRRARSAGLRILDGTGHERGGFSTFDDGSVVLGMDAPGGVGAAMPDRIGLVVYPDGSAHVMLIDNETRAVVKLASDGNGGGGVQTFRWDMDAKQIHIRTTTFDGDERTTAPMGQE